MLRRALCVRITYVGELGYELTIPAEQAVHVYDRVIEAGRSFGLKHAGVKALGSLRLEKGYRDYGHDIDNTDDPWSCGLEFAVRLDREIKFIGKSVCLDRKAGRGFPRRLLQVLLRDPEPLLVHSEVVLRNGTAVGEVRAASYGHTLGGSVGLAMVKGEDVNADWLKSGKWSVNVAGRVYPAEVSLRPMYDPEMKRIKA